MRRLCLALTLAAVHAFVFAGCDSTEITPFGFNPFNGDDAVFSLYGTLDAGTDVQAVRVAALRTSVDRPATADEARLPLRVFSRRVGAADSVEWIQRVAEVDDGVFASFFETSRVAPRARDTYTLRLAREDGQTATATTTVPPPPTFEVGAVRFEADRVVLPVVVTSAFPVTGIEVVYRLATLQFNGNPYPLSYAVPTPEGDRYVLDLDLTADALQLRDEEPLLALEPSIPTNEVQLRVRVAAEPLPDPNTVAGSTFDNAVGWWIGTVAASFVLPFDRAVFNPGGFCEHPEDPLCLPCAKKDPRPRCESS
ncbi:MAG: hypothetical protein AAGF99_08100 [Bacteroidota bacterium]